jgi:alpha-galactosidase
MIMMNTWGDRNQDSKINEKFSLLEVEKAAELGITHFQIDDGWQTGKSPNSATAKGFFKDIWDNQKILDSGLG